jgi:hypothetical protein
VKDHWCGWIVQRGDPETLFFLSQGVLSHFALGERSMVLFRMEGLKLLFSTLSSPSSSIIQDWIRKEGFSDLREYWEKSRSFVEPECYVCTSSWEVFENPPLPPYCLFSSVVEFLLKIRQRGGSLFYL